MGCSADTVVAALRAAAETVAAHRDELVRLDREIGDGDHGENMDRGFRAVAATVDAATPDTPAAVLKRAASTLISTVGGASGPLYGTGLLRASTAMGDAAELDGPAVAEVLRAAMAGVAARGKAVTGDKTMLDALSPAVDAARSAADSGADSAGVLDAAATAAHAGVQETGPMVARKGRASYLGERSAGHLDPGARSTALLLSAFADAAASNRAAESYR